MAVALGTTEGHTHPDLHRRVDPVDHRRHAEFLIVGAALGVGHGVAMKTRGNPLRLGRVREHVPGELLDGELVKRQVVIDRPDHPVPPGPDRALGILCVAGRISVAGQVQPDTRPALPVGLRGEQAVDQGLVSSGALVIDESLDLLEGWRQPGEIERQPANDGVAVGLGSRLQSLLVKPPENEWVDRITHPARVGDLPRFHRRRGLKGPVLPGREIFPRQLSRPLKTLVNPGTQGSDLRGGQLFFPPGRHGLFGIRTRNQVDQQAFGALAGQKGLAGFAAAQGAGLSVQPEIAFVLNPLVAAVAGALEDRQYVLLVANLSLGSSRQLLVALQRQGRSHRQEAGTEVKEFLVEHDGWSRRAHAAQ